MKITVGKQKVIVRGIRPEEKGIKRKTILCSILYIFIIITSITGNNNFTSPYSMEEKFIF